MLSMELMVLVKIILGKGMAIFVVPIIVSTSNNNNFGFPLFFKASTIK